MSSVNKETPPLDVEGGHSSSAIPKAKDEASDNKLSTDTARVSPTARNASPQTQTIQIIEHNNMHTNNSSGERNVQPRIIPASLAIGKMGMISIACIVGLAVLAGFGWFEIPSLNDQIDRLKGEVNRLENEINRLSNEVDNLGEQNNRKRSINGNLSTKYDDLIKTNLNLQKVANNLNGELDILMETNSELKGEVVELRARNDNFSRNNSDLEQTEKTLNETLDIFNEELKDLIFQSSSLFNVTGDLEDLTEKLAKADLNGTVSELNDSLNNVTTQVNQMEMLHSDLVTVIAYLGNGTEGLTKSLGEINDTFIEDSVDFNAESATGSVDTLMKKIKRNCFCDNRHNYGIVFKNETWAQNEDSPIDNVDAVITYVNECALKELCLDSSNFKAYLLERYSSPTTVDLESEFTNYTNEALDFYYPEKDDNGLSLQDWEDATFNCEKLPDNKRYFMII